MAGKDANPWPDWNKPATKGDVIRALFEVRGLLVKSAGVQVSLSRGEDDEAHAELTELLGRLTQLGTVMDEIGGKK